MVLEVLKTPYGRYLLVEQPECRVIDSHEKRKVMEHLRQDIEKRRENRVVQPIRKED